VTKERRYYFYFNSTKIPISNFTIRRSLNTVAYCNVTIPDPEPYNQLISDNINGALTIYVVDSDGVETLAGSFILDQVQANESANANTVVLSGRADFGVDLASSISGVVINKQITKSTDSTGKQRFSADENCLLVVGDEILLQGLIVTIEDITIFVNVKTSRMDVAII